MALATTRLTLGSGYGMLVVGRPTWTRRFSTQKTQAVADTPGHTLDYIDTLVERHTRHHGQDCIVLEGATCTPNPLASKYLGNQMLAVRPSLGVAGEKYERGLQSVEELEVFCSSLLQRLFGNHLFVEARPLSGAQSVLAALMATTQPGDHIFSLPTAAAGHVTHHTSGAAGLYGLKCHKIPFDGRKYCVDTTALSQEVKRVKPAAIVLGSSMQLFDLSVAEVADVCRSVGARLIFDAAHVSGIIAGGGMSNPLEQGADVLTSSTYKSFGGPPGGFLLAQDQQIAEAIERIAFPGLIANTSNNTTAALAVAAADLVHHGHAYVEQMLLNAKQLALELNRLDVPIVSRQSPADGSTEHTTTHFVALSGGSDTVPWQLERVNILCSAIGLPAEHGGGGVRLGVQECTRRGMKETDMKYVAQLISRALAVCEPSGQIPLSAQEQKLLDEVLEFRRSFGTSVCFVC